MTHPGLTPLVTLLAEDDGGDADAVARSLRSADAGPETRAITLIRSRSAGAACDVLGRTHVDAVLLDLDLPDARGLSALRRIREAAPATPVIVMSGHAERNVAAGALRAGAQDYVLKPLRDRTTLARVIRYACERQRLVFALDASHRASAKAEQQWRLIGEISATLALPLDLATAIERVAKGIVPSVADCFVLFLGGSRRLFDDERHWILVGSRAHEVQGDLLRLLRRHGPAGVSSTANRAEVNRTLTSRGLSGTVMPLHVRGHVRGLIALATASSRGERISDASFAGALTDRIDVAVMQASLLRRAQCAVAARDRAVSIVSHDLRNPLNTIQICAQALLDPAPAPARGIREMGQLILGSAAWMGQIVEELLDRASLDSGRLPLHRRPTEVQEIFSAAQAMFGSLAASRNIEFVLGKTRRLPPVDADPHRLLQALSNLLGNAMKFTAAGGRVELLADAARAEPAGPSRSIDAGVRFSVRDTGPGIPSEDLAHVFDWFWHSPREAGGGLGLGLAIAKGIVEAHRGHLQVESSPGQGSTFWFTVPAAPAHPRQRGMVS